MKTLNKALFVNRTLLQMNPDLHWMLTTAQAAKYVHLVLGHRESSHLQMWLLTSRVARARTGCAHHTIMILLAVRWSVLAAYGKTHFFLNCP